MTRTLLEQERLNETAAKVLGRYKMLSKVSAEKLCQTDRDTLAELKEYAENIEKGNPISTVEFDFFCDDVNQIWEELHGQQQGMS